MRRAGTVAAAAMAVLACFALAARAADPDALWKIVHGRCVPGAAAGDPSPCADVSPDWAVLKDRVGATQFLLIPTARVTGIEDPAVLAPGAPNYFAAAWDARRYAEARAGHPMPPDTVALAINPPGARSQDQLHIHVDCIQPGVRDALGRLALSETWAMLPDPLAGQSYMARRIATLETSPFRLVADALPGPIAQYTLVVTGGAGGFILLAGRMGADGRGHGEDLQDHGCALARDGAAPPA